MYRDKYQAGFLSIFFSGNKPAGSWRQHAEDGYVKILADAEVKTQVYEIISGNTNGTYISAPQDPYDILGVRLPVVVLQLKYLKKYFHTEIQVLDNANIRRRFIVSNFNSRTVITKFVCTIPLRLDTGWNQLTLDIPQLLEKAYGTKYEETLRVTVYANCRLKRVFFSEKAIPNDELPQEYRLYQEM